MTSTTYKLSLPVFMLHDRDNDRPWLKKRIDSGDYFISLATKLDMISQELPDQSYAAIMMKDIVRNLEYLQEKYDIVKKDENK